MAERARDFQKILETLSAFERCRDPRDLRTLIISSVAQYGFEHVSVMAAETKINRGSSAERTLLSSWPRAWFDRYHSESFVRHDPVAAKSRTAIQTFRWSEAIPQSKQAKAIMDAARDDHRLKHGLCVPIRNFEGYYAAVSFAGEQVDQSDAGKFFAELVAIYAFKRLSMLTNCPAKHQLLTCRQREIMTWVAAGKTAWDVSVILNLSVNTVNKTIVNAMERLDVRTRAQAIAEAIRRGEITP